MKLFVFVAIGAQIRHKIKFCLSVASSVCSCIPLSPPSDLTVSVSLSIQQRSASFTSVKPPFALSLCPLSFIFWKRDWFD
ncbi:unnamed protein product [Citrullus colocynthis]|uniref:Secreted protein n=1 Tax=Citrullus colocynthis TaxID=252529 RepID=A0ABP0Y4B4_9ROSI